MDGPLVDLILRQRQRVDVLAQMAGRFMDPQTEATLRRLSGRLSRVAATLRLSAARTVDPTGRLQAQLERFVREIQTLQIDDADSIARTAWAIADVEETICATPAPVIRPVYTAN